VIVLNAQSINAVNIEFNIAEIITQPERQFCDCGRYANACFSCRCWYRGFVVRREYLFVIILRVFTWFF